MDRTVLITLRGSETISIAPSIGRAATSLPLMGIGNPLYDGGRLTALHVSLPLMGIGNLYSPLISSHGCFTEYAEILIQAFKSAPGPWSREGFLIQAHSKPS